MAPAFASQPLREITTAQMQTLLVHLAKRECGDTVKGVRNYLRAIFREAREEGILERDPARKLVLPQTRKPSRPYLTPDQIQAIEPKLAGRTRSFYGCSRAAECGRARYSRFSPKTSGKTAPYSFARRFPAGASAQRRRKGVRRRLPCRSFI